MTVGVRTTTTRVHGAAGKYYAEFKVDLKGAGDMILGLKDATAALTDAVSGMFVLGSDGGIHTPAGWLAYLGAYGTGDVICLAWDSGTKTFWFRKNSGSWNNSGSADPATGAGGFAATADTATYALWFRGTLASDQVVVRTEAADLTLTPPAGFTSWMGETIDAWNVNDKSTGIALSNSDKTATYTSGSNQGVRSTTTRLNGTAGKYYAEFVAVSGTIEFYSLLPTSSALTGIAAAMAVAGDGWIWLDSVRTAINIGTLTTAGDVACVAWDAGSKTFWFRKNSGLWNNSGTANPATGTGGIDASALASTSYALHTRLGFGDAATLRTEAAEFTQSPLPSGFTSWMGETINAWNVNDKSTSAVLSNSDKTVTNSDGLVSQVRSTTTVPASSAGGKFYAEILVGAPGSDGDTSFGIHDTTSNINSGLFLGSSKSVEYDITGNISFNGALQTTGNVLSAGNVVSVALDTVNHRGWIRRNNDAWNHNASANPATNVGGFDTSAWTGQFAVAAKLWFSASNATIRTEAAGFTQSLPSGFTSWMGEALSSVTHYTLTADVGAVTLAGIATGLRADRRLTAATGAVAVAGIATGLRKGYTLAASTGAVAVTRYDANLIHRHVYTLPITVGAVVVTFNDAGLTATSAKKLAADTGTVTFAGYAAGLRGARGVLASKGSVILAGQAATLRHTHVLTATTSAVTLSGKAATLRHTTVMPAAVGAVTFTGYAAGLRGARGVLASKGSVTLNGQATTLRHTHVLTAATGAVAVAGKAATLRYAHVMPAAVGVVTLTGYAADLRKAGALSMGANTGAVTVGGQAATLRAARVLKAEPSSQTGDFVDDNGVTSFIDDLGGTLWVDDNGLILGGYGGPVAVTGYAATLTYAPSVIIDITLPADTGAVTVAGQVTGLRYGHALIAAKGAVTVTFNDANLKLRRFLRMIAAPGGIILTGVPVGLSTAAHKQLAAAKGAIVLSGKAAELRIGRKLPALSGPIVVTGSAVDLNYVPRVHYRLAVTPGDIVLTGQQVNLLAVIREKQPGPLVFGRRLVVIPGRW